MLEEADIQRLVAHGERIRRSGALGKSPQINRLFELLLERSLANVAPKEIEIAQMVFGRATDADLAADATVRVHVHRLRKKLEELPPDEQGERLTLPRGEYRLVVASADVAHVQDGVESPRPPPRSAWTGLAAAAVLLIGFNLLGWIWLAREPAKDSRLDTHLWSALAGSRNPTLILYGDQYVFGEQDANGAISRVIFDPHIGSREDLEQYKMRTPGADQKYIDLNSYSLPEGAAPAMAAIAPVVLAARAGEFSSIKSMTMSRFTNGMLRSHDLVYLGLLRNLGDLKEPLFEISGFSLSASDDSLIDRSSGNRFQSDWANPSTEGIMRRDYAYLASLPGPSGNHIVVVAGTRDPALMEAIQIASDKAELDRLSAQVGKGGSFEALYEVRTFGPSNVANKLVVARRLEVDQMWPAKERSFPIQKAAPSISRKSE